MLQEVAGLRGTQLVAFEQFCVRDTLHDLQHLPKQLRPAVARVNCHTYTSATFFHKAAKPLVLLQVGAGGLSLPPCICLADRNTVPLLLLLPPTRTTRGHAGVCGSCCSAGTTHRCG